MPGRDSRPPAIRTETTKPYTAMTRVHQLDPPTGRIGYVLPDICDSQLSWKFITGMNIVLTTTGMRDLRARSAARSNEYASSKWLDPPS